MGVGQPQFDLTVNYYQVLDVPYTATKGEITRAYRSLIRHAHPDRFADEEARRKAEERTKLLNTAYTVLSKSSLRRQYDQAMRQQLMADALFQRYTGNVSGQSHMRFEQAPPSPEMVRKQRQANRSALLQFLLAIILFVAAIAIVVVVGSLAWQGLAAVFV